MAKGPRATPPSQKLAALALRLLAVPTIEEVRACEAEYMRDTKATPEGLVEFAILWWQVRSGEKKGGA